MMSQKTVETTAGFVVDIHVTYLCLATYYRLHYDRYPAMTRFVLMHLNGAWLFGFEARDVYDKKTALAA